MLSRAAFIVVAVVIAAAAPAHADGTVFRAQGCSDYIFVSSESGFSILVGSGAIGIKDGDQLRGDVDRLGEPILFDTTAGHSLFAHVAEHHLTRAEIARRVAIHCRSPSGDVVVSGYVSRGCGSSIFVNTPKGYAILERLAGGVVADGDTLTGPLDRPGRITVEDRQSRATLVVFVKDLWLSKSAVERKMAAACRR